MRHCILICGISGSGKTTLAKIISQNFESCFVVKSSLEQFSEDKYVHLSYSELQSSNKVHDSLVIIDDTIKPNDKELAIIYDLLVRRRHHEKIAVIVNCHAIEKNCLNSLIPHFSHVIFTNSPSNLQLVKIFASKYFLDESKICMKKWDNFVSKYTGLGYYLSYKFAQNKFDILDSNTADLVMEEECPLRGEIEQIFSSKGPPGVSMALFDYLLKILGKEAVSPDTYMLKISAVHGRKSYSCSVLDLIHYITVPTKEQCPVAVERVVTCFLQKAAIPVLFVLNPQMMWVVARSTSSIKETMVDLKRSVIMRRFMPMVHPTHMSYTFETEKVAPSEAKRRLCLLVQHVWLLAVQDFHPLRAEKLMRVCLHYPNKFNRFHGYQSIVPDRCAFFGETADMATILGNAFAQLEESTRTRRRKLRLTGIITIKEMTEDDYVQ